MIFLYKYLGFFFLLFLANNNTQLKQSGVSELHVSFQSIRAKSFREAKLPFLLHADLQLTPSSQQHSSCMHPAALHSGLGR